METCQIRKIHFGKYISVKYQSVNTNRKNTDRKRESENTRRRNTSRKIHIGNTSRQNTIRKNIIWEIKIAEYKWGHTNRKKKYQKIHVGKLQFGRYKSKK